MKNKFYLLTLIALLAINASTRLFAIPVDLETAKKIGYNILEQPIFEVKQDLHSSERAYYILQGADSGFVIIASNDVVSPIIGYSYNSRVSSDGKLPPNMESWLDNKAKEIYCATKNDNVTPKIEQQWIRVLSNKNNNKFSEVATTISPLINTKWGQSPLYNHYTPGNSPTGCVATSMAQIMNYWKWPKQGKGNHCYTASNYQQEELCADFTDTTTGAYRWDYMPLVVDLNDYTTVARLMYYCGVAVEMNYGESSSGAKYYTKQQTISNGDTTTKFYGGAFEAFTRYFNYKNTIIALERTSVEYNWETQKLEEIVHYTTEEWIDLLKLELNAKRPMAYQGGGHSWICDGYDADNNFHMNWGWEGLYDGYFNIEKLNPGTGGTGGGTGQYNNGLEGVLIGIESPEGIPISIVEGNCVSNVIIAPNPTNAAITLKFDTESEGILSIVLVDLLGCELLELHNEFTKCDRFAKTFSLEALPKGIYYLKINHNGKLQIKKVIRN